MTAHSDSRIKTVQITGRRLDRLTATEMIGGVMCRITLQQDHNGRYQEVSCTPVRASEATGS